MLLLPKSAALLLQIGIGLFAFGVAAFSPPAQGRMIVVPLLTGQGAVQAALRNGAGIVGRGPIAGSVVIEGDLARLARPLARVGAILLAAPRGCGERVA